MRLSISREHSITRRLGQHQAYLNTCYDPREVLETDKQDKVIENNNTGGSSEAECLLPRMKKLSEYRLIDDRPASLEELLRGARGAVFPAHGTNSTRNRHVAGKRVCLRH